MRIVEIEHFPEMRGEKEDEEEGEEEEFITSTNNEEASLREPVTHEFARKKNKKQSTNSDTLKNFQHIIFLSTIKSTIKIKKKKKIKTFLKIPD